MSDKQIKLLTELAQKLKAEKLTKEKILSSFVAAGILNKQGDFTKPYQNLNAAITTK